MRTTTLGKTVQRRFPAGRKNVAANPEMAFRGTFRVMAAAVVVAIAAAAGSALTITERGSSSWVSALTCPTCGTSGLTIDPGTRRATLAGPNGMGPGIKALVFTNTTGDPVCRSLSASVFIDTRRAVGESPACSRSIGLDFDGDGKADPALYSPSTRRFTFALSSNNYQTRKGQPSMEATDRFVPADYDGDGKTDFAVWRPSTGQWFFVGSTGVYEYHNWGQQGDSPLVGDFDGDGKADFAVWRPSNGTVYIKNGDGTLRIFQFGIPTDRLIAADFDGDGMTDVSIFRSGTWYILGSHSGFRLLQFGQAGDIPVPRDYDGDGATDLAVFRAGVWYTLTATAYTVNSYGRGSDIPVPADYDGDGKADRAVFTPSEGRWRIRATSFDEGPFAEINIILGRTGDIPIESNF